MSQSLSANPTQINERPDAADLIATEWVEITLTLPLADAELAGAILERFIPSGTSTALPFEQGDDFGAANFPPAAEARVSGYVPAGDWPALEPLVQRAVATAPWRLGSAVISTRPLLREDWETAWHAFVQIVRTGRLVIRPTSIEYEAMPGEVVVDLEPGLAFGTGQHETTRLALRQLARRLQTGDSVLDFGCGSGILTCAAARLGAGRVDAVDLDPLAVMATEGNVERNRVATIVHVAKGSQPPPEASYHLVVANITAGILAAQMPALSHATLPGGVCILSGIIDTRISEVEAAIAGTALEIEEIEADGEWRAIVTTRPAAVP